MFDYCRVKPVMIQLYKAKLNGTGIALFFSLGHEPLNTTYLPLRLCIYIYIYMHINLYPDVETPSDRPPKSIVSMLN